MSEDAGSEGTAFFSVENNFSATEKDFEALESTVARSLSAIRNQFSSFQGVDFNPLDKVSDKVNQQAGLIERRLQELARKYQAFAKTGVTPDRPFSVAAGEVITRGSQQVDRTVTAQATKLGDADLAQLRRTLVQGLTDGATIAARELQKQLSAAARDAGRSVSEIAGSPNTLRANVVARPVLADVPESQSAADYVAATKAATRARQDAANAASDSAATDRQAARASKDAAAKPKPSATQQPAATESATSQTNQASNDAAAATGENARAQRAAAKSAATLSEADDAAARAVQEAAARDKNPSVLSGRVTEKVDTSAVTVRQLPVAAPQPSAPPASAPAPAPTTDVGAEERVAANGRAAKAADGAATADEQDAAATREATQQKRAATRRRTAAEAATPTATEPARPAPAPRVAATTTPTVAPPITASVAPATLRTAPDSNAAEALASNEQRLVDAERELAEAALAAQRAIGAQRDAFLGKAAAAAVLVARINELIVAERDLRSTATAATTVLERQARASRPSVQAQAPVVAPQAPVVPQPPAAPQPRPAAPVAPAPPVVPATPAPQPAQAPPTQAADQLAAAQERAAKAALDAAAANERAAAGEGRDEESASRLQAARTSLATALQAAIGRAQESGRVTITPASAPTPAAPPETRPDTGLAEAEGRAAAAIERAAQSARAMAEANELARRASLDASKADADTAAAARERAKALRSAARVAQLAAEADARAARDAQRDVVAARPADTTQATTDAAEANQQAAQAARDAARANDDLAGFIGELVAAESADRESATRLQAARSVLADALERAARTVQEQGVRPVPPTQAPPPPPDRDNRTVNGSAKAVGDLLDRLRERLESGLARFINSGSAIFDPSGPQNRGGNSPIINAETLAPETGLSADRLMQQVDAELGPINRKVAELEAQITRGELVALNARVATQPLDHPDDQRTFISRQTAEPVDLTGGQAAINDATRLLTIARQKQTAAAEQETRQAQFLAEIEAGTAQFLDRSRRVAVRTSAPVGEDIVNARTAEPLPTGEADQLRRQLQDQINRIRLTQAGVDNGSLVALNSRLATQAPGTVSDADRTIIDRATGQVTDNLKDAADGARLFDKALRDAATDTRQAAARAAVEQRVSSGDLVALNSRFATRPPTETEVRTVAAREAPPVDTRRGEIFDRNTGEVVQDEADVQKALRLLADVYQKAAQEDLSGLIKEAEEQVRRELLALAEDVAAKRRAGIAGPDTGVQFGSNGTVIDERRGAPSVVQLSNTGVQQLDPDRDRAAATSLRVTADRAQSAATAAATRAERDLQQALTENARAQRDSARASARSGVGNNFVAGLTSGGFGGDGEKGLDGLARAAGQTAKYSALYSSLNLLRQGLAATISGFLDANDSITEYEIATQRGGAVTADFQNRLETIAQVSGFNVGEALDVASKGVRAFGDEIDKTSTDGQAAMDRLGEGFARQATRLATLSKTTLEDAAGNLTAVSSGFNLPKNEAGFTQVTDAIAGSKLAGGGDETQIFQGLASAAVTFKALGFSLNESATILSKINAQTDESGQLIATRLSRLTSVLNGNAAKTFIANLNQQLPKGQQVDTTAPQRDQLIQLSAAFQTLGAAQKGALISALGGTAEERELSVLLQNLQGIVKEADNIKPGAGLKEFQERLQNVRAQLTQIQGFVQGIIVNLTTSGLADPIIEMVAALRGALEAVSFLTQGFNKLSEILSVGIGGSNISLVSLVANVGALVLALKALQAIRNAGGIRGALEGAEATFRPAQAVARQQLNGTATAAAASGTGGVGAPIAGVQGRAEAAIARVNTIEANPAGVAADADVRAAGQRVRQSAEKLARAEEEQAALILEQTRERRTFRADPNSNGTGLKALNERQEQARADAAQAGITAQLDLASAQAELARAERVQAAQAEVAAQFDARRTALSNSFQRQIGVQQEAGTRAFQRGDDAGLQAAMDRELVLRDEFNVRLGALEAERVVAEQRATAIANASRTTRVADAVSLGGVGAATVARQEGAGLLATAGAFSSTAIRGIGSGIASLFKFLGPVGVGLTVADFAFQVKGAVDDINAARRDLKDVDQQFVNKGELTPQGLKSQSESEASAGENLKNASGGFLGRIADAFTDGRGGAGDAKVAEQSAEAFKRAAEALAADTATLQGAQSPKAAAASTLDVTSPDTLKASFDALQSSGYTASQSMDLLITRLGQLRLVASKTADLTDQEKTQIADSSAALAGTFVGQLPAKSTEENFAVAGPGGSLKIPVTNSDPARTLDVKSIQDRTQAVIKYQLGQGTDVFSDAGTQQLEQALVKGYEGLVPDAKEAADIAHKMAAYVQGKAKNFATQVNSIAQVQSIIALGLAQADADASSKGTKAQLGSLNNGTRDDSAAVSAKTRVTDLQRLRAQAQAKLATLQSAGTLTPKQVNSALTALDDKIAEAQVQQAQALIQSAQQQIADNQLIRRTEQRKAKTTAQIRAIGQKFFKEDIKTALKTNDIETIKSVFDNASQAEVNAILSELDSVVTAKKAAAAAAAAAAKALAALAAAAGAAPGDRAGGAVESFDKANADIGNKAAADAAAAAAKAQNQANAARKASQLTYPTNTYNTGSDRFGGSDKPKGAGGATDTAAQIAAANAQAQAVRDRNSTEGLRAAVQAARADLAAAKTGKEKAQARQALYSAENALDDQLHEIAVASRFRGSNPTDSITNDRKAVAEARAELGKYARGTLEYYQALAGLRQAQQQLSQALGELSVARKFANINPNDSIANARKSVAEARVQLSQYARGSLEYYQALASLRQAQQQLGDSLKELSVARRFVNTFPESQVQSAKKGLAEAKAELSKYAKGSLEYYQALAGLVQAQRQVSEAAQQASFLKLKLNTDLTNPVAQARLAVREAQAKLRLLQREKAPADLVNQAKLDLKDAQNGAESAAFSQRLQDAQTNDELGRISHTAYLKYLDNEHNRLTAIRHRTRQQQDELNQIDLAIKAANDQFSGQFNIGDIKVPTIYEVRRAIANQTGRDSVVANSQVSTTNNNNVTINGADFAKVVDYLKSIIGPQGASRITPIPRKG